MNFHRCFFLIMFFFLSCNNANIPKTDSEVLNYFLSNRYNEKLIIDEIIYIKAPSVFKEVAIDFDYYQANFKNINNNRFEVYYFTISDGEIYRLGKGLNCLIFSKQKRWDKDGDIITNFSTFYKTNSDKKKLYNSNPSKSNLTSMNSLRNELISNKFQKFTCK